MENAAAGRPESGPAIETRLLSVGMTDDDRRFLGVAVRRCCGGDSGVPKRCRLGPTSVFAAAVRRSFGGRVSRRVCGSCKDFRSREVFQAESYSSANLRRTSATPWWLSVLGPHNTASLVTEGAPSRGGLIPTTLVPISSRSQRPRPCIHRAECIG